MFEIRQDEIATTGAAPSATPRSSTRRCAQPLADPGLYSVFDGDNLDPRGGLISWRHAIQSLPLA